MLVESVSKWPWNECPSQRGLGVQVRMESPDGGELWRLDCAHGYRGRQFDELPRFYRTARGAKQAAALLTGERLTWALPASTNC